MVGSPFQENSKNKALHKTLKKHESDQIAIVQIKTNKKPS